MEDSAWPVHVEAQGVIGYPAVRADAVSAKERLAEGLGQLVAESGQVLHGLIGGPTVGDTDLDNALLYNVGGSVARSTRAGICLERQIKLGATKYRYRVTPADRLHAPSTVELTAWPAIPLARLPGDWTDVWQALRGSDALETSDAAPLGPIWLDIDVGTPVRTGCANATLVKVIVDGVLTALHDSGHLVANPALVDRLAIRAHRRAADVKHLLRANDHAVLGATENLLVLRGTGLQCRPDDERVAWLRILIRRDTTTYWFRGRVGRMPIEPDSESDIR